MLSASEINSIYFIAFLCASLRATLPAYCGRRSRSRRRRQRHRQSCLCASKQRQLIFMRCASAADTAAAPPLPFPHFPPRPPDMSRVKFLCAFVSSLPRWPCFFFLFSFLPLPLATVMKSSSRVDLKSEKCELCSLTAQAECVCVPRVCVCV